ncbi:hypothetical protein HDU93_001007, partial [Gonapodya sp. JEL0774]
MSSQSPLYYVVQSYNPAPAYVVAVIYVFIAVAFFYAAHRDARVALRMYILLGLLCLSAFAPYMDRGEYITRLYRVVAPISGWFPVSHQNRAAHHVLLIGCVAIGITAAVWVSVPDTPADQVALGNTFRHIVTYVFIALVILYGIAAAYAVFLIGSNAHRTGSIGLVYPVKEENGEESPDSGASTDHKLIKMRQSLLVVVIPSCLLLIVRLSYSAALLGANPYTDSIYQEAVWYPLTVGT